LGDLVEELFSVDGGIYRSVWLLFARPGFLTREMFADRRAAHVSPLRLYLFFSVLFFAAFALAPGLLRISYGTPIWGTLWRMAIVTAAYWLITILALLAIWLPAILPIIRGRPEGV